MAQPLAPGRMNCQKFHALAQLKQSQFYKNSAFLLPLHLQKGKEGVGKYRRDMTRFADGKYVGQVDRAVSTAYLPRP